MRYLTIGRDTGNAILLTAISGGYGHFIRRNLNQRTTLWLGGFGILGVIIGSWVFTVLSSHAALMGLIVVFLWPAIRMIREGLAKGIPGAVKEGDSIEAPAGGLAAFGGLVGLLTGLIGLGGG